MKKLSSHGIMQRIGILLLILGISTAFTYRAQAAPAPDNHSVLILDSSVTGGSNGLEGAAATTLGFTVVDVTDSNWLSMSTSDFESFQAIILGDPTCGTVDEIDAAVSNRTVWAPAIKGNIVIIGTDPVFHQPSHAGAGTLISDGINFVTSQKGKTGAYLDLSCYYTGIPNTDTVDVLDQLGAFSVTGVPCEGTILITASSPAIASLTATDLSDWECSVHETFVTFPGSFIVLAKSQSDNLPYILARGKGLVSTGGGSGCFESIIAGLGLSRPYTTQLMRQATIIERSAAVRNTYAVRHECQVLNQRLAALVRLGVLDSDSASSLSSCCDSLLPI